MTPTYNCLEETKVGTPQVPGRGCFLRQNLFIRFRIGKAHDRGCKQSPYLGRYLHGEKERTKTNVL